MVTIKIPQDTTFSFEVPGRYACNTLDEALDSTNPNLPDQADARPFDYVVIGGGSFGAALTARLFNLDVTHSHRILVVEAGPLEVDAVAAVVEVDLRRPGDVHPLEPLDLVDVAVDPGHDQRDAGTDAQDGEEHAGHVAEDRGHLAGRRSVGHAGRC